MKSSKKVTIIDFSGKHLFIGIDVHKNNWVVTVRALNLELRTFSIDPFPQVLERILLRDYPGGIYHLVYEAGCFGYASFDYFNDKGIDIIVTPPNRVYRETGAIKTDKRDSRELAKQLDKEMLKKVIVPTQQFRELRQMLRIRDNIQKRRKQIMNEITGMLRFLNIRLETMSWGKSRVAELKGLVFTQEALSDSFALCISEYEFYSNKFSEINRLIKKHSQTIGEYTDLINRLTEIRGIGILMATTIVLFLFDRKDRFESSGQLVHYLGLTPGEHSSGEKQRKGGIVGGNPRLRAKIIQIAWKAVRWDPVLLDKYNRVYQHSGITQKAIVAVARKLMVRIYTIVQNNERYQVGLAA